MKNLKTIAEEIGVEIMVLIIAVLFITIGFVYATWDTAKTTDNTNPEEVVSNDWNDLVDELYTKCGTNCVASDRDNAYSTDNASTCTTDPLHPQNNCVTRDDWNGLVALFSKTFPNSTCVCQREPLICGDYWNDAQTPENFSKSDWNALVTAVYDRCNDSTCDGLKDAAEISSSKLTKDNWNNFVELARTTAEHCALPPDSTNPTVDSFSATANLLNVNINYTVSDSGGSYLNRVEVWRASDNAGSPDPASWTLINTQTAPSSSNNFSSSYTDTPGEATWWYGIHVYDNTGNDGQELTPQQVVVVQEYTVGSYTFTKRKMVTVQSAAALTDFPVYLNVAYDSDMQSNFNDLYFANTSGTVLPYERDSYAASTNVNIWVKTNLAAGANQIYMYYGNPTGSSLQNKTAVWNSNYKMVLHMNEDPSPVLDSTANGYNGTKAGVGLPSRVDINTGRIGYAQSFSAANTYLALPNSLGYTTSFSAFAWFKKIGPPGNNYHIIFGGQELEISIPDGTTDSGSIRHGVYNNIPPYKRYVDNYGSGLIDGNWHSLGFTYNGSTKLSYIDGNNVGASTTLGTLVSSFSNRRMGVFGSNTTYYAKGIIDEVVITNSVLSADWILQSYNMVANQSSNVTFGVEQP